MKDRAEVEARSELQTPIVCPESHFQKRNLNFEVIQISDCLISSSDFLDKQTKACNKLEKKL